MPDNMGTEVIIAGKKFTIMSNDKPEHLRELSLDVDESIRKLIMSNIQMTIENAAILTALNFCDDIHKLKEQPKEIDEEDRLMQQIIEYSKELSELSAENKRLKKVIDELKKK